MVVGEFRADFHIHTCLSACAEVEMIPPLIVDEALHKGLHIIAVTDHNAVGNVGAVIEAAAGTGLWVLPGMELQCQEEVDALCLFDTLEQAQAWEMQVRAVMLPFSHDAERFGPQYRVDAEGDLVAEDDSFYQGPAQISLEDAAHAVHALGGLFIPAHIERPMKGLLGVLGLWPPDLEADAAEVSPNLRPSAARKRFRLPPELPLITSSDAHWLDGIGSVMTIFVLEGDPSITELRLALRGAGQRRAFVP